jgi:hypothetical protein
MQLASIRNISSTGAVVQGISRQVRPGEILEMQLGEEKSEFRVVWVGRKGTEREGEIGLESLAAEPCLWDVDLCRYSQFVGEG